LSLPVTTLSDVLLLAHKQYGIRFQLGQQQLVDFGNMIQYIAYNKDMKSFENWDQRVVLGQDVFLETDSGSYTSPVASDIGKTVSGDVTGALGKLLNFKTQNRINKWIIEPPDGGGNDIAGIDGETLTIGSGTGTGVAVTGQDYLVSNGPYKFPLASDGYPPFRKLIGITQLSDEQRFNLPPSSSFNGYDDYGLLLNGSPGSRHQNYPITPDLRNKEVTLKSSTPPEISQTEEAYGPAATTLNTSKLRWIYYVNPPPIESVDDETNLIIPEEYRYEILFMGITRLADTSTYGDRGTVREIIEPLCKRFWEDMRTQYQAYGDASDWISEGVNGMSKSHGYTLGRRRLSR